MSNSEILDLLTRAQSLAKARYGISNILQPGIVKELVMAEILGHTLIPQKDLPDAKDDAGNFYEYLASIRRVNVMYNKGCSFQMDRVTRTNLSRVTRNRKFYFGIFKDHLTLDEIWEVDPSQILNEVNRQLGGCKNDIAHVNFLLKWLEATGKRVFPKP